MVTLAWSGIRQGDRQGFGLATTGRAKAKVRRRARQLRRICAALTGVIPRTRIASLGLES